MQTFRDAYQADPADVEVVNNLGHALMKSGDVAAAESFIVQALVLSPDRSSAWADLAQLYAKQGNIAASVACFANAYRFARNKDSSRQFLQRLAKDGSDNEREAAAQALQLKLTGRDNEGLSAGEITAGQQNTGASLLPPVPVPADRLANAVTPNINTQRPFTNEGRRGAVSVGKKLEQRLRQEGFRGVSVHESGIVIRLTGEVSSRQELKRVVAIANEEATGARYTLQWEVDVVSSPKSSHPQR